MSQQTKLRGRWAVAFVVGVLALIFGIVMLFRLGFSSPHLVAAAIPVNESELLLLTSPVNRRPVWVVYGFDGKPRRPWGNQPLPGGVIEEPNGKLRSASEESAPLAVGMSRVGPGEELAVRELVTGHFVRFQDPPGILLEKVESLGHDQRRLERVRHDGSVVWSQSLAALMGELSFGPTVIELRHSQLRDGGTRLLLIIQAYTSFSARPVDAAVSRIVIIDAASGRVSSRTDIARPPS